MRHPHIRRHLILPATEPMSSVVLSDAASASLVGLRQDITDAAAALQVAQCRLIQHLETTEAHCREGHTGVNDDVNAPPPSSSSGHSPTRRRDTDGDTARRLTLEHDVATCAKFRDDLLGTLQYIIRVRREKGLVVAEAGDMSTPVTTNCREAPAEGDSSHRLFHIIPDDSLLFQSIDIVSRRDASGQGPEVLADSSQSSHSPTDATKLVPPSDAIVCWLRQLRLDNETWGRTGCALALPGWVVVTLQSKSSSALDHYVKDVETAIERTVAALRAASTSSSTSSATNMMGVIVRGISNQPGASSQGSSTTLPHEVALSREALSPHPQLPGALKDGALGLRWLRDEGGVTDSDAGSRPELFLLSRVSSWWALQPYLMAPLPQSQRNLPSVRGAAWASGQEGQEGAFAPSRALRLRTVVLQLLPASAASWWLLEGATAPVDVPDAVQFVQQAVKALGRDISANQCHVRVLEQATSSITAVVVAPEVLLRQSLGHALHNLRLRLTGVEPNALAQPTDTVHIRMAAVLTLLVGQDGAVDVPLNGNITIVGPLLRKLRRVRDVTLAALAAADARRGGADTERELPAMVVTKGVRDELLHGELDAATRAVVIAADGGARGPLPTGSAAYKQALIAMPYAMDLVGNFALLHGGVGKCLLPQEKYICPYPLEPLFALRHRATEEGPSWWLPPAPGSKAPVFDQQTTRGGQKVSATDDDSHGTQQLHVKSGAATTSLRTHVEPVGLTKSLPIPPSHQKTVNLLVAAVPDAKIDKGQATLSSSIQQEFNRLWAASIARGAPEDDVAVTTRRLVPLSTCQNLFADWDALRAFPPSMSDLHRLATATHRPVLLPISEVANPLKTPHNANVVAVNRGLPRVGVSTTEATADHDMMIDEATFGMLYCHYAAL